MLILCILGMTYGCFGQQIHQSRIFPQPQSLVPYSDGYVIKDRLTYPAAIAEIAEVFAPQFLALHRIRLEAEEGMTDLRPFVDPEMGPEAYVLRVKPDGIHLVYGGKNGLIYGLQSLDQWMGDLQESGLVQGVEITDAPAFSYRGVHLDCSRHFFTVAEVKQLLDQLVGLKINTFHWHLTDDQGWRLEIRKYPRLTEIGAWRDSTVIGHYSRTPREYERKRYGGFYSQEDAREIVRYAAQRGITVMPEIELPGHARAALAAYPELGCTGSQLPVPGLWGVFDDVFCTKAETIGFLKDVLTEVLEIFPSETIHIGGDECPKVRWDACPACQKVRAENDLHDSHELQSYVIREIGKFLRSKGRKLMGWDEILEGGLAENAQVMSWRGTEGGIVAAKAGHPVVMTPTAFCYFDYYQSGHPDEPLAIGGFLPLEKVYRFQPVPDELSESERRFIRGGQANLWTEYLPAMNDVYYNAFPRLVAMAQVLWTRERPGYDTFVRELVHAFLPRLDKQGINYSTAFLDPELRLEAMTVGILYRIHAPLEKVAFRLDGRETEAIPLERSLRPAEMVFAVTAEMEGKPLRTSEFAFTSHSLLGKPVHFETRPHAKFNRHDAMGLTDGVRGRKPWKGDQWLGFSEDSVVFTIDLGEEMIFDTLELGCLHDPGSWIYRPGYVVVQTSTDGRKYKKGKRTIVQGERILVEGKKKTRYLRISVINSEFIPEGLPGAGNTPWTFLDELMVY